MPFIRSDGDRPGPCICCSTPNVPAVSLAPAVNPYSLNKATPQSGSEPVKPLQKEYDKAPSLGPFLKRGPCCNRMWLAVGRR